MTLLPHSLHRSSHKACTCLRGRDIDSAPQWESGKFLEASMGLEILLQPLWAKTISQGYQQFANYFFTQWPRAWGAAQAALMSRMIFREHPSLTTLLRSDARRPRGPRH